MHYVSHKLVTHTMSDGIRYSFFHRAGSHIVFSSTCSFFGVRSSASSVAPSNERRDSDKQITNDNAEVT
jgi:hypothetical protein